MMKLVLRDDLTVDLLAWIFRWLIHDIADHRKDSQEAYAKDSDDVFSKDCDRVLGIAEDLIYERLSGFFSNLEANNSSDTPSKLCPTEAATADALLDAAVAILDALEHRATALHSSNPDMAHLFDMAADMIRFRLLPLYDDEEAGIHHDTVGMLKIAMRLIQERVDIMQALQDGKADHTMKTTHEKT